MREINVNKKLSGKELLLKEIEILKSYRGLAKSAAAAKIVELEAILASGAEYAPVIKTKAAKNPESKGSEQVDEAGGRAVADPKKASQVKGEQAVVDPVSKKKIIVATPSKKKK
jgi:hypothetical protein